MNSRSQDLIQLRPQISTIIVTEEMSDNERFQSKTIRPIIKLQSFLFIAVFKNYIRKHKNFFFELSIEKKLMYIENAVQKDTKFRNSLKGMVIGQFTVEEYEIYVENSSGLNKRMMYMVIEQLKDHVQAFDEPVLI